MGNQGEELLTPRAWVALMHARYYAGKYANTLAMADIPHAPPMQKEVCEHLAKITLDYLNASLYNVDNPTNLIYL